MSILERIAERKVLLVELTPPSNSSGLETVVSNLSDLGVIDGVNITNNSLGVVRPSLDTVVPVVRQYFGYSRPSPIPIIANITSRDTSNDPESEAHIERQLERLRALDISDVLIINGDPYQDGRATNHYTVKPSALVEEVRAFGDKSRYNFGILFGVSGDYAPERLTAHLKVLKRVHDNGANGLMTKVVANGEEAERYIKFLRGNDIDLPVIGHVMFIDERRMDMIDKKSISGSIPDWYRRKLLIANEEDVNRAILDYARKRAIELLEMGYAGVVFNIINRQYAVWFKQLFRSEPSTR